MARQKILLIFYLVFHMTITAHAQEEPEVAAHSVQLIEGEVLIQRSVEGSNNFTTPTQASVGTPVKSSDLLDAPLGSQVVVLCADQSVDIIAGEQRRPNCNPVPFDPTNRIDDVVIYGQTRTQNTPYIVSPRNSITTDRQPMIEISQPPPVGQSYVLEILNIETQTVIWRGENITGTQILFPLEQPLNAVDSATGQAQSFQVLLFIKYSDGRVERLRDPNQPQGFCIISGRRASRIDQQLQAISAARLPPDVSPLMVRYNLANFYYRNGLFMDARRELLALLPSVDALYTPVSPPVNPSRLTHSPSFYLLLARVFYGMRLVDEMTAAYQRAEELATLLNDYSVLGQIFENRADIERGVRRALPAGSPTNEAIRRLYEKAQEFYKLLGDTPAVARLDNKLNQEVELPRSADFCPDSAG